MNYHRTIFLVINALVYAAIGLAALSAPERLAEGMELSFVAPRAIPEFLATFGGLMLAIAAGLVIALVFRRYRASAFALMALAYAGFAGGRLFGMLAYTGFDWRNGIFLALEILLLLWALACYREVRRPPLDAGL